VRKRSGCFAVLASAVFSSACLRRALAVSPRCALTLSRRDAFALWAVWLQSNRRLCDPSLSDTPGTFAGAPRWRRGVCRDLAAQWVKDHLQQGRAIAAPPSDAFAIYEGRLRDLAVLRERHLELYAGHCETDLAINFAPRGALPAPRLGSSRACQSRRTPPDRTRGRLESLQFKNVEIAWLSRRVFCFIFRRGSGCLARLRGHAIRHPLGRA